MRVSGYGQDKTICCSRLERLEERGAAETPWRISNRSAEPPTGRKGYQIRYWVLIWLQVLLWPCSGRCRKTGRKIQQRSHRWDVYMMESRFTTALPFVCVQQQVVGASFILTIIWLRPPYLRKRPSRAKMSYWTQLGNSHICSVLYLSD